MIHNSFIPSTKSELFKCVNQSFSVLLEPKLLMLTSSCARFDRNYVMWATTVLMAS